MALADDIRELRDRVRSDLNAAHDYYSDSITAWGIVRRVIAAGEVISVRSATTGTLSTETELAAKAPTYVSEQLTEATFQQFVSIFENFFFDLLRLWLSAYPQSLGGKKLDFQAVLDSPDKEAVTMLVVNKEVNEVAYDRPAGWFKYFNEKANLGCPAPDEIDRLAEIKASRDVLVHNRGVANRVYESKAGRLSRRKDGDRIDISERYHRQSWELLCKLIADISNAAITKAP